MENNKLNKVKDAILSALTFSWDDNGSLMADAVKNHALTTLSEITGETVTALGERVNNLIEDSHYFQ